MPLWAESCCGCLLNSPARKASDRRTRGMYISEAFGSCREIRVALCGGHIEITQGIDRVIVVGAMIGEALITTRGAKTGDDIMLTKALAIDRSYVIARQKGNILTLPLERISFTSARGSWKVPVSAFLGKLKLQ